MINQNTPDIAPIDTTLMDCVETCRFFGGNKPIHPATLYRGIKTRRYPPPIKSGGNRWIRGECVAARAAMIAERDGAANSPEAA